MKTRAVLCLTLVSHLLVVFSPVADALGSLEYIALKRIENARKPRIIKVPIYVYRNPKSLQYPLYVPLEEESETQHQYQHPHPHQHQHQHQQQHQQQHQHQHQGQLAASSSNTIVTRQKYPFKVPQKKHFLPDKKQWDSLSKLYGIPKFVGASNGFPSSSTPSALKKHVFKKGFVFDETPQYRLRRL